MSENFQRDIEKIQTLRHHEERIWCVSFNNAGTILASCGEDKLLCLWVLEGSIWKYAFSSNENHTRTIRCVSWSPTDRYLATASFDSATAICRVDVTDGIIDLQTVAVLQGHVSEVKSVAWSRSGYFLATCGRDKSVWIWEFDDEEDVQCTGVLQPHDADVKSVFWHPIIDILGSTSYDNSIKLYKEQLDDWAVACKITGHESTVWKAEFSPNGDYLASVSEDRTIKLWEELPMEKSMRWICLRTLSGYHCGPIFDLSWSPCGHYLATCGEDNSIFIFYLESGLKFSGEESSSVRVSLHGCVKKAHKADVNSISWRSRRWVVKSVDRAPSYLLVTGGDDREINLWSVPLIPDIISEEIAELVSDENINDVD
nr:cytosolic iron sulfur protein assembly [Hymenolepis microstoma]